MNPRCNSWMNEGSNFGLGQRCVKRIWLPMSGSDPRRLNFVLRMLQLAVMQTIFRRWDAHGAPVSGKCNEIGGGFETVVCLCNLKLEVWSAFQRIKSVPK
jgi:hypothetical protein